RSTYHVSNNLNRCISDTPRQRQVLLKILQSLYFVSSNLNLDNLLAVGCDRTIVNTGSQNGSLDGDTIGPRGFVGQIGKSLETCQNLEVVAFKPIACYLPDIVISELSTDQKYLHQMCSAISSGKCFLELSNMDPGKLARSRWLTTANRILRLYIGTKNPTSNLNDLTQFIES
ncbi:hypothetical protein RN001_007968, partial [Aquatica leii]